MVYLSYIARMRYLASLHNKDFSKETVLVRVDFNIEDEELNELRRLKKVPLRIQAIVPTIRFLRERGARVVLLSHRGRPLRPRDPHATPGGKHIAKPTLRPFAHILTKLLGDRVHFFPFDTAFVGNPDFTSLASRIAALPSGSVMLLGNLRFFKGEEDNSKAFGHSLARLGTMYVNDAFAVSHRANASVSAITTYLPSYAGLLLEQELIHLSRAMRAPKKPLVVMLGGGKVHDKIAIIRNFYRTANYFLTGGGIANTFLAAQGLPLGDSLFDATADASILHTDANARVKKIIIPEDFVIHERAILDIGPHTAKRYADYIQKAGTILWNGPMGYIEDSKFERGTKALVRAILESDASAVVGGGETTGVFQQAARGRTIPPRIFLSTGGGAMLEYLAGARLPGLVALERQA